MAKAERKWTFRACFRPNQHEALGFLAKGVDRSGRGLGYAQAWHRTTAPHTPYCLANEYICGRIGMTLGLPIPPFAITHGPDGQTYFSSLDFNFTREKFPPVLPDKCVAAMPTTCASVLAFDILIANEDRWDENLVVDQQEKPKYMHVFDHDVALFGGGGNYKGIERLKTLRDHIAVNGDETVGGARHVFLDEISDPSHLWECVRRIGGLPPWVITDACEYAEKELGITAQEAVEASDFLIHRRDNLSRIMEAFKQDFTKIPKWPAELFQ